MFIRETDIRFMRHALGLARLGLGRTWPNPSVACVMVKNERILSAARTADSGRPHAEKQALTGIDASGATAYVTLEPCAHGDASCAAALAASGITRAVIACRDNDPRTNGQGIAMLKAAGIEVIEGICEAEAQLLNAGFFRRIETSLPLLAIKTATSLDGKIADSRGESQWITGEEARHHAHLLRAQYDAIITGINTVLADNSMLNCRIKGLEKYSPVRVVLDSSLRFPPDCNLAQTASEIPVWVLTASQDTAKRHTLEKLGIQVTVLPESHGHVDAESALRHLARQGITRLLAEGGAALNAHLLPFAQELYWYRAPIIIGEGKSAFEGWDKGKAPSDLSRFTRESVTMLGVDTVEFYRL